jgi:hypothetical protein
MDDLYYLDDGVYRAVERGPAMVYVLTQHGKRKAFRPKQAGTWVHLEKIGPPVHDRGSPRGKPRGNDEERF